MTIKTKQKDKRKATTTRKQTRVTKSNLGTSQNHYNLLVIACYGWPIRTNTDRAMNQSELETETFNRCKVSAGKTRQVKRNQF